MLKKNIFIFILGIICTLSSQKINAIESITIGGMISEDLVLSDTSKLYVITSKLDIMPGVTLTINPGVSISGGIIDPNYPEIILNDNARLKIGAQESELVTLNDVRISHDETSSPYGEAAIGIANVEIYNTQYNSGDIFLRNSDVQIKNSTFSNSYISFYPTDTVNIDIGNNLFVNDTILNISPQSNSVVNVYNNSFNNLNYFDIYIDFMFNGVSDNVHINNNNFLYLDKEWVIATDATSDNIQILDLSNNYWRTTDTNLISRIVLDHNDILANMVNVDISSPKSELIVSAPTTEIVMPFAIKEIAMNDLSGIIYENTTLTLAGSPYYVGSILNIGENITLTVEEGVEIFGEYNESPSSNSSQIILSTGSNLVFNGSNSNKIKISNISINTDHSELSSDSSFYHNIAIQNTNFSKVQLSLFDSKLTLSNNTFTNNSVIDISAFKPSHFTDELITSNIINNLFLDSNIHVYLINDSNLNIKNNTFNSDEIYDINFQQLSDLTTLENIHVNENNFLNFNKDFIIVADGSSVYNNISLSIDFSNNYWRSQTTEIINKYIFDHENYYGNPISLIISTNSQNYFENTEGYTFNTDFLIKNKDYSNVLTGLLYEDTILSNVHDKYILFGNLDLLPGVTLTIENGVEIESSDMLCFNGVGGGSCTLSRINLYGDSKLIINGTESSNVKFNSVRVETNNNDSVYSTIKIDYLEGKNVYFYLNKNLSQITNSMFISNNILTEEYSSYHYSDITYVNPITNSIFSGNSLNGNSYLSINKAFGLISGLEITNNTFNRNGFGLSSEDHDIRIISTEGSDFSNILINNNNFVNPDKQYFLYTYSDSGDTLNLKSNFWRNLTDAQINNRIYDNTENSNVKSFVDISNQLLDFNTSAPKVDYYNLNGVQDNESYNHSISIEHNYRAAWLNEVQQGRLFTIAKEGKYILRLEKDDSTIVEINFEIDLTKPIVEGVSDRTVYTESKTISFNEGIALLNNVEIKSGYVVRNSGTYLLNVTDDAGNFSSITFTLEIPIKVNIPESTVITTPKVNITVVKNQPKIEDRLNTVKEMFSGEGAKEKGTVTLELKELLKEDPQFVKQFSTEEKASFEALIKEVYKDNIIINTNESESNVIIEGLLLNSDLNTLVNGGTLNYDVQISYQLNEKDQRIFDNYISVNTLNSDYFYPIDINISELIDGVSNNLSELSNPLTITLPLPEDFEGMNDLVIVHIHNGEVEQLEVTVNDDGTFSFTTDKLSSFTLIQGTPLTTPIVEETEPYSNLWLYGLGLLFILGLGFAYKKLRKN